MAYACDDIHYMRLAIQEAKNAALNNEVPVGAVVIDSHGDLIATGFNKTISNNDPTAHAEIIALRKACTAKTNYRLPGASLYVTLEPCVMCIGAIMHARISRVVYGAQDPKTGACESVLAIPSIKELNHQTRLHSGVMADQCSELLRKFFAEKRGKFK